FPIIIPAYDEEAWLPATLGSVREEMEAVGLRGEVIVVDNNSTDKTAQVASDYGASVIFEPVNQISPYRGVKNRSSDFKGEPCVGHRWQRLVLRLDEIHGVLSEIPAGRDHYRDRLSHVTHLIYGQRRL
ncbi:MAG: glycosyltransferase, partial [Acidobacteria bacterium]|nr:glycosyltransferase [Acidobacteriota bacterium]